jgi:nicotinamide mononucleotide transporter
MTLTDWLSDNWIEVFGAIAGIVYVFLEIRQNLWLWPVGIVTSGVYIWVFFKGKIYADMSLQVYYLVISIFGWYWWVRGTGHRAQGEELRAPVSDKKEHVKLAVSRVSFRLVMILLIIFLALFSLIYFILDRFTDSPVPGWDSFITSLSIVATWMLARKLFEHWYLWIIVNFVSAGLFLTRGLYPTVILYLIYFIMSFAGLRAWKRTIHESHIHLTGGTIS